MANATRYCAYVLRGWRETTREDEPEIWRFRLRNAETGDEWGFASLDALASFLVETFDPDADVRES